jgi:nucleolar protein 56
MCVQVKYLLFEAASGYSLFEVKPLDNVALSTDAVQQSISDMARFSKIASLIAFKPFSTAADALEQINSVSESLASEMLISFLQTNLPKVKDGKKAKCQLGVVDAKLGNAISETAGVISNRGFMQLLCFPSSYT